jgi:hypothetical protein
MKNNDVIVKIRDSFFILFRFNKNNI